MTNYNAAKTGIGTKQLALVAQNLRIRANRPRLCLFSVARARSIEPAMDELGEAERQVVASYWWQRAHGELTSFHGFQHVLADLRDEQAAPAVIELAERAVQDEYQHAQWCRDWALRFGHPGGEITPRGERPIAFRGATEAQNRLLRIALCCMNECGYAACSRVTLRATSTACALQLLRTCSGKTVSCAVAPISV